MNIKPENLCSDTNQLSSNSTPDAFTATHHSETNPNHKIDSNLSIQEFLNPDNQDNTATEPTKRKP